jgi:hypothetical protein
MRMQSLRIPPMTCRSDGVSLHPCRVTLDESHPVAKVTARGPKGGTFGYDDTQCSNKGIAVISGAGKSYMVTAGGNAGKCTATFTDKKGAKTIGSATLHVTNEGV